MISFLFSLYLKESTDGDRLGTNATIDDGIIRVETLRKAPQIIKKISHNIVDKIRVGGHKGDSQQNDQGSGSKYYGDQNISFFSCK